jgi:acetolactate decarboxylase
MPGIAGKPDVRSSRAAGDVARAVFRDNEWLASYRIGRTQVPIDTTLIGALHVEYLKQQDLGEEEHPHHTLFQTSTIDALLEGKYDGDVSFAELEGRGDFGLGTLDALDGEMIALDGSFYQVRADGRAYAIDERARTPFAVVTFFEPNLSRTLDTPMDFETFCARLDRHVGGEASCYAVRVEGHFDYVKTRSVPRQRKPYPPLAEVVEHQPSFELYDVAGSLVGFRFPRYAQGLNVAGYHFHFITADRSAGGHVLEFRMARGELRVDSEADLRLELPPSVDLPAPDPSAAKREELDRIERE